MTTANLNLLNTGIAAIERLAGTVGLAELESDALLQFIGSELVLRGSMVTLLAIGLILLLTKNNAAERSLLWLMLIIALALMPGFALLMPHWSLALTLPDASIPTSSGNWLQSFLGLFGSERGGALTPLLQSVLLALYSLVAIAALSYLITAMISLLAITRRSTLANESEHRNALLMLDKLSSRGGIESHVTLLFSPEVQSPLTWGIWRHFIILPASASAWQQDLLAQALSHELAHIQRMDWASHMLSRLVLCLYWFNPVNWWLHHTFIEESEKACDQMVIDDTGCAITYAENLLWFADSMRSNNRELANALLKSRSALYRRVQYILADQHYYSTNGRTGLCASIIFSILLVAPASAVDIKFVEKHVRPPPSPQLYQVSYYPRGTPQHTQLLGQFGNRYSAR